jgi:O-antigen/teichoic acid export membrane protein
MFSIVIFIFVFSDFVVNTLFSVEFSSVSQILQIHIIAVAFVFWGTISSKFFLIENKFWITVQKSVGGALINIALNYFLIPDYGSIGAAIATIISYFFSDVLFLFFYKTGKTQLLLIFRSFNLFRILISLKNKYLA